MTVDTVAFPSPPRSESSTWTDGARSQGPKSTPNPARARVSRETIGLGPDPLTHGPPSSIWQQRLHARQPGTTTNNKWGAFADGHSCSQPIGLAPGDYRFSSITNHLSYKRFLYYTNLPIDTTVPSSSRSRTQPSPAAGLIFRSVIFNSALRRHTYRAQHTQTFSAVRPHSDLVTPPLTSRPRDRNLSPGQLPWTLGGAYSSWRHHDDTMPKEPTMTSTKHQPRRLSYHVRQPAWSSGDCSSAGG